MAKHRLNSDSSVKSGTLRQGAGHPDPGSATSNRVALANDLNGITVSIVLDHLIVPTKDRIASARLMGTILGVPWAEQAHVGPFSPVFVNEGLTLDFDQWIEPVPKQHYCFKVSQNTFDEILERIRSMALPFRSTPHGPNDGKVNPAFGGSLLYWSEPDGHTWEILTVSYARQAQAPSGESAS